MHLVAVFVEPFDVVRRVVVFAGALGHFGKVKKAVETVVERYRGEKSKVAIANISVSFLGERNNPPIGTFTECDGVRPRWDVWMMSGPAIPVLGDLVRFTIGPIFSWAILPMAFRKLFAPRSVPRDFKNQFPASLTLRPKQLRAAAEESAFLISMAAKFQSHYPSIRCPVHIFHGAADQIIEPEQARYLHRALPASVLHLVEDAGHMVTYADGAGIAEAVEAVAGGSNISRLDIKE